MSIPLFLTTNRLLIKPLNVLDDHFIFELLNTEGWLTFIGNRNINSIEDAKAYIQKIIENSSSKYWVVQLKNNKEKIGVVSYIKRAYLEHHDIGFAFLPHYCKKGYAYEATSAVLYNLIKEENLHYILATTIPQNIASITLLKKLGLVFQKELEVEKEKLHLYGASIDQVIF